MKKKVKDKIPPLFRKETARRFRAFMTQHPNFLIRCELGETERESVVILTSRDLSSDHQVMGRFDNPENRLAYNIPKNFVDSLLDEIAKLRGFRLPVGTSRKVADLVGRLYVQAAVFTANYPTVEKLVRARNERERRHLDGRILFPESSGGAGTRVDGRGHNLKSAIEPPASARVLAGAHLTNLLGPENEREFVD